MNNTALNQYKTVGLHTGMVDATPHQMITMLLDGALDRVASAKGAIERQEIARKGELLGSAISIIDGIRAGLDHERGGEIAANLRSLYDYIESLLVEANTRSSVEPLAEVTSLLSEIKLGWDSIPSDVRSMPTC